MSESRVTVEDPSGRRLLLEESLSFWTEHSQRATLTSWAACLNNFPPEWLDKLGRWGASRSQLYVRTYRRQSSTIQTNVALGARAVADPHKLFDEEALFGQLGEHLEAKGVGKEAIREQTESMLAFRRVAAEAVLPQLADSRDGPGEATAAPRTTSAGDAELAKDDDEEVALEGLAERQVSVPSGHYVVTFYKSRRRLHRVGQCYRIPGKDYHRCVVLGVDVPDPSMWDDYCRHCWKHGLLHEAPCGVASGTEGLSSQAMESSGSSTSSSESGSSGTASTA